MAWAKSQVSTLKMNDWFYEPCYFPIAPCLLFRMWEYTRFCCWVVCASFPSGKRSFTLTQQSAAFEYAIHKCFMKVHECYFLKGTACHGVYLPHSNIIRVLWSTRRVLLTHLRLSFLQDDRVIVESLKSYAGSAGISCPLTHESMNLHHSFGQ